MNKIAVVFWSGTGGTGAAASCIAGEEEACRAPGRGPAAW